MASLLLHACSLAVHASCLSVITPAIGRRDAIASLLAGAALSSPAAATAATPTEADVAFAVAQIAACKAAMRTIENLARYDAWADAVPLMRRPPLSAFAASAAALATGPGLSAEQKQTFAVDAVAVSAVLTGISGLEEALGAQEAKEARTYARQAAAGLDQLLDVCRSAGLFDE